MNFGFGFLEHLDIDPAFAPQQRNRSNTWPLPKPEPLFGEGSSLEDREEDSTDFKDVVLSGGLGIAVTPSPPPTIPSGLQEAAPVLKKNSSRRNAWGNMSYADLITQAIQNSPESRLTLSQIYEWMVQNVPYFKDKGDSNSSAGWKNSIRHNLSLHNRFMRVQNEGTGKSSWWMINPEAKPGKGARRRAASMETSKFEKKRGRAKKKVDALRSSLLLDATPSPSSSISEGLDLFPDSPFHPGFQLSPDFRPRASSNASSCGRLSPIPSYDDSLPVSLSLPLSAAYLDPSRRAGGAGSNSGTRALESLLNWNSFQPPQSAWELEQQNIGAEQLIDNLTENMSLGEFQPDSPESPRSSAGNGAQQHHGRFRHHPLAAAVSQPLVFKKEFPPQQQGGSELLSRLGSSLGSSSHSSLSSLHAQLSPQPNHRHHGAHIGAGNNCVVVTSSPFSLASLQVMSPVANQLHTSSIMSPLSLNSSSPSTPPTFSPQQNPNAFMILNHPHQQHQQRQSHQQVMEDRAGGGGSPQQQETLSRCTLNSSVLCNNNASAVHGNREQSNFDKMDESSSNEIIIKAEENSSSAFDLPNDLENCLGSLEPPPPMENSEDDTLTAVTSTGLNNDFDLNLDGICSFDQDLAHDLLLDGQFDFGLHQHDSSASSLLLGSSFLTHCDSSAHQDVTSTTTCAASENNQTWDDSPEHPHHHLQQMTPGQHHHLSPLHPPSGPAPPVSSFLNLNSLSEVTVSHHSHVSHGQCPPDQPPPPYSATLTNAPGRPWVH